MLSGSGWPVVAAPAVLPASAQLFPTDRRRLPQLAVGQVRGRPVSAERRTVVAGGGGYLDDDEDDEMEGAWTTSGGDVARGRRQHPALPPAYSHSPPQPAFRRHAAAASSPAPILRPDNYTLKRAPRPAPAAEDGPRRVSPFGAVDPAAGGHLLGGYVVDEPGTLAGDTTTDSGYSLQRSTAPPSPAPLDIV